MTPRERRQRTRKVAIGGMLAAGVVGLGAGPAAAAWPSTPPNQIAPFPPAAFDVDLSQGLAQGTNSIVAQEIDWYSFVSPKTGLHSLSTSTPNSGLDSVLAVYDGAGNRLAYNDDGDNANDPLDSELSVQLTGGVRYYFGITNWSGNPAGGEYSFLVQAPK